MIAFLTMCIVLLSGGVAAPEAQDSAYEARARRLLEVAASEPDTSFFTAAARIRLGRELPVAYAMIDSLTRDKAIGGMFYAYELIGTYLHCRTVLPDSLHRKIREAFRVRTMYRGDTENHWVMYHTGLYLAAQTWPGEPGDRWFNGRSSEENFRDGAEWLREWMKITTTRGQGEFDSPTYFTVFLGPMLVLQEFATDPEMKRRAGMMVDLLLADFGAEHLGGNYGGGHSRDYPDDMINPLSAPATMWAWLFFGEPRFEPWTEVRYRPRHRGSWEAALGALSTYRVPPVVYAIATDRSKPYVHTETKRVRNVIRFGEVRNPPVYKYTYMTPDFVIGSLQGGILQPIQQHTWDVTFLSPKPNNTIFTLHPFASGRELAMFFPEEQQFLAGEVDRYHKVYTSPDKWNSSSPYEQVYQHRGSLIVLYDIPPGTVQQHTDGFFPKNLDERIVDPSGWIFCRSGKTMVGLYPTVAGNWIEEAVNFRLRTPSGRSGFVVEAAGGSEGRPREFQASLRKRTPRVAMGTKTPSVRFVTADGKTMEFRWDGTRTLDGKPHSFAGYGLYHGPFVNGEIGTGIITLTAGGRTRVLDFARGVVSER